MDLYIIRHGQSTNNALMEDFARRVKDPELTEIGQQQAEHVARFLAEAVNLETLVRHPVDSPERETHHPHTLTHLYTSPMLRALQTSAPIARALGIKPEVWIDIHEIGGIWLEREGLVTGYSGMTRSEILATFPDYALPETITNAGWYDARLKREHVTLCQARAMRVAWALRERANAEDTHDDRIAIVTHAAFTDHLLKALTGRLPGIEYAHWVYNTSITAIQFVREGRMIVRYINRVDHLPPELVT